MCPIPKPDPLSYLERIAVKLHTGYLRRTYPFFRFGDGVSIHTSCEIPRQMSPGIAIGDGVLLGKHVWLNTVDCGSRTSASITIGSGCAIGRRSVISAKNRIFLDANVLLGPSVLIMDHNHDFSNPDLPIRGQGTTPGGQIIIERNCWLGFGSVVVCNQGELVLGRNSIVGANAVVTRSFPPFSVIAGIPAKLIRRFEESSGEWTRIVEELSEHAIANRRPA